MKNFRKVLALVLVVATLFSFASIAGAKTLADYTDADEVNYDYAVAVLSAVGVLNGYEDDTFKPENTISREEMAKMIAVMANATDDISKLYAAANTFADVENDRWSASYISYCAHTGIVAGRSADVFDPYGKVTGLETAKMLLVVMGMDAAEQGYVGANWKVNVLRDAKNMGLLNDFAAGYDADAAITREEAAQMMLNALKGQVVVGVLSDDIIKVTNAAFIVEIGKLIDADLIDSDKNYMNLYGNVIVSKTPVWKALYGWDLDMWTAADCFGRMSQYFNYTVNGIVIDERWFVVDADYATTEALDISAVFPAESKAGYTVRLVRNGFDYGVQADEAAAEAWTGNGVDTVVYVDAEKQTLIVNVIETFVGKVANVNDYTNTFDIVNADNGKIVTGVSIDEAVEADDIVLFNGCLAATHARIYGEANGAFQNNYTCHDYYVVEPTQVKMSYVRDYDGYKMGEHLHDCFVKTTEGVTYKFNENYADAIDDANIPAQEGETWNLYLDKYGYVMWMAEPAPAAAKVAYFEEGSLFETLLGNSYGTDVYKVTADAVVYGAETTAPVEIEIVNEDALETDITNRYLQKEKGLLAAYKLNAYGKAYEIKYAEWLPLTATISNDTFVIDETNKIYADADTVFMLRTTDPATGDWTYAEYTGWKNIPEGVTYVIQNNELKGKSGQWLNIDTDLYADYVFIEADVCKVAEEFFIMGREYTAQWDGIDGIYGDEENYYCYRALVNGVDSFILTAESTLAVSLYEGGLQYVNVVMTEDGGKPLYIQTTAATPVPAALEIEIYVDSAKSVYVEYDDGSVKAGADLVNVYHILGEAEENDYQGYWTESNKINKNLQANAGQGWIVFNAAGTAVTAVYLLEAPASAN